MYVDDYLDWSKYTAVTIVKTPSKRLPWRVVLNYGKKGTIKTGGHTAKAALTTAFAIGFGGRKSSKYLAKKFRETFGNAIQWKLAIAILEM